MSIDDEEIAQLARKVEAEGYPNTDELEGLLSQYDSQYVLMLADLPFIDKEEPKVQIFLYCASGQRLDFDNPGYKTIEELQSRYTKILFGETSTLPSILQGYFQISDDKLFMKEEGFNLSILNDLLDATQIK